MTRGKRMATSAVVLLLVAFAVVFGGGIQAAAAPAPVVATTDAAERDAAWENIAVIVVLNFYDAINNGDFDYAYSLLGNSWRAGQSYDNFVQGFASTAWDDVYVLSYTQGRTTSTATISLDAYQKDGSVKYFTGTYTVGYEGGTHKILSGTMRQL